MSEPFFPRVLGITGSIFLSGFAFSASYYTLPATSLAPLPLRLKQWLVVYDLGKLISPPVSFITATSWFYTAWATSSSSSSSSLSASLPSSLSLSSTTQTQTQLYATAGILTLGTTIWTLLAMMPTNQALIAKVKVVDEGTGGNEGSKEVASAQWKGEAERELGTWSWMNYVRAVIPLVGGWVGIYAALK